MINGDVNDFVDRISYGDELIFTFHGRKYFLQGYHDLGGLWTTYRDRWEPPADDCIWVGKCDLHFPVEEFLRQRIWDGRTFWEAQEEMEWAGIPVLDNWIPESVASYLLFGGNFTGNVRS